MHLSTILLVCTSYVMTFGKKSMQFSSIIRKVSDRVSELNVLKGFHFIKNIKIRNFLCHGGKNR